MSAMDFKISIEMIQTGDKTVDGLPMFGFRGVGPSGKPFHFDENGKADPDGALADVLGSDLAKLKPKYGVPLLLACLAVDAAERLIELGVEVREPGRVRVASVAMFREWETYERAAQDPKEEQRLKNFLRARFGAGGPVLIERTASGDHWFSLSARISITPEVIAAALARLTAWKAGAPRRKADQSVDRMLDLLGEIVWRVYKALGPVPADGEPDPVLRGIIRWLERALDAVRSRDGQIALLRLFVAIAFGDNRPTEGQIRKLRDALPGDVRDVIDSLWGEQLDDARRAEARSLLRDVLLNRFRPRRLSRSVEGRLARGHLGLLRRWLVRALEVRSLASVFAHGSESPSMAHAAPAKAVKSRKRPAKASASPARKPAARAQESSGANRVPARAHSPRHRAGKR